MNQFELNVIPDMTPAERLAARHTPQQVDVVDPRLVRQLAEEADQASAKAEERIDRELKEE